MWIWLFRLIHIYNICDCILENWPCCHKYWIPFLSVDESCTHALSRDTKHLGLDGHVCFCRRLFFNAAKPRGGILRPVWPLRGFNKTAWGAKLILTADLVYQVSFASLGELLMAQHCHLCLNVCLSPPTAPHPPPPPIPPPFHPPTPYRLNPRYYSHQKKLPQEPVAFK